MKLFIDYGGTNFRYTFGETEIFSTQSRGVDLTGFLDSMIKKHSDLEFIGISYAGQVSNGRILSSPNIEGGSFDIKKYIDERYDIELEIENDLNCAALAEYELKRSDMMAVFYIGTGFGSAFLNYGKLIKTKRNLNGEMGHIPFMKTPFRCGCGRDDCLELSCSGSALQKWSDYNGLDLDGATLENIKSSRSKKAAVIYQRFFKALEHAFYTALNLFDPDSFILGGGVAKNNPHIVNFLKNSLKKSSFASRRQDISIEISTLKNGSLEGAKKLARI